MAIVPTPTSMSRRAVCTTPAARHRRALKSLDVSFAARTWRSLRGLVPWCCRLASGRTPDSRPKLLYGSSIATDRVADEVAIKVTARATSWMDYLAFRLL